MARTSDLRLAPLPGASRESSAYRTICQRDNPAPLPRAHELDGHHRTTPLDSAKVDIASLLKSSAANASSATPTQQCQSSRATTIPAATTLPPIIGPPSSYTDVGVPSPTSATYGARARRKMPQFQASGSDQPAKKQSKWSAEEDALIIELRGSGMKWDDISKRLPGRSPISCRLHYQNYLEKRSEWDEERKNKLARLYERQVTQDRRTGCPTPPPITRKCKPFHNRTDILVIGPLPP